MVKGLSRILCASFFIGVGILHFVRPKSFIKITPKVLVYRKELVYVTGAFEILGGLGLLVPWTRRLASDGLIWLLLAVFPANINMAVNRIDFGYIPQKVLWARLPMQLLLIAWVKALGSR
jgi:uncharacterized membrane protein